MARKTVKKELTTEERLEQEKEQCYNELAEQIKFIPSPTHYYNVGDEVLFGAFKRAVIEEVLADGKAYLLYCDAVNSNYGNPIEYNTYRLATWTSIRLRSEVSDTDFTENDEIRLYFSNTSIESLLHKAYYFGIKMNPDYQRDFVWDDADKEYLIDSIFKGVDIGKFVLVHRTDKEWHEDSYSYEILDGKQRLNTLKEFYENRFPYKGKYFTELSNKDRYTFQEHMISVAEVKNASKKDILIAFLKLNRGGRVMDKKQIEKVEKMLKDIKNGNNL